MRSAIAKGLILYVAVPYFKLALGLILLSVSPFYMVFAAMKLIQGLFKPTQDSRSTSRGLSVSQPGN